MLAPMMFGGRDPFMDPFGLLGGGGGGLFGGGLFGPAFGGNALTAVGGMDGLGGGMTFSSSSTMFGGGGPGFQGACSDPDKVDKVK